MGTRTSTDSVIPAYSTSSQTEVLAERIPTLQGGEKKQKPNPTLPPLTTSPADIIPI